jgi:putative Flp pilus-assembly TadE/G-like protein/galactose oxidase-like protein
MNIRHGNQRGSVIVIVALWLPLLVLFASLAVDAGHWWDYSRNLQNRADAAALAGGDQLAVCIGSPTAASERGIGEIAQQYSGPPTNTPDNLINLPYSSAQMTTDGFTPYFNLPNLTSGQGPEGANYHLLLNSSQYWPAVGQNGANGYGDMGSYCHAVDPSANPGDPGACLASSPCAMVDARITQANVPMFFNLLGFHPNITAHARVQLEVVSGSGIASPIGVGDAGDAGCAVARVVDETNQNAGPSSNGVLAQWQLNEVGTSTTWTASMPGNLTIPTSSGSPDLLGLQAVIPADCSNPFGGGDVYDMPSNGPNAGHGIVFINTYKPLSPSTSNPPARGSVWLTGGSCTSGGATNDPYFYSFKTGTCPVTVHAEVDFPTPPAGRTYGVSISGDGGATYVDMPADSPATDTAGNTVWAKTFNITPQSGKKTFAVSWYLSGSGGSCTTPSDGTKSTCQFDGGNPVQATFSAFNDGTDIDDSGPIVAAGVGCDATSPPPPSVNACPTVNGTSTSGASSGADTIPGSGAASSPKLTATFTLQGLAASGPTDKAAILRSSVQSGGRNGIFDCGQGGSASAFENLMLGGGCGTYVPPGNNGPTSSLQQYSGPLSSWSNCVELPSNPITCAEPDTGNMRGPVRDTIANLICGPSNPTGSCSATPPGKACDYWDPYRVGAGPLPNGINDPGDPRAIEMVITSPQDLALAPNDPRWIRILGFATFYVTGWDGDPYLQGSGTTIPGCNGNLVSGTATNYDEPYPYPGGTPSDAVWGHFIEYVFPGQGHQGQNCVPNQPLACTPALTR